LWINADAELDILISNPSQQIISHQTGVSHSFIPRSNVLQTNLIGDDLNPENFTSRPYLQLTVKYPASGYYNLSLASTNPGTHAFEIYVYDREGESRLFKKIPQFESALLTYVLSYDQENIRNSYLIKTGGFKELFQKLLLMNSSSQFINQKSYEKLYKYLVTAEKVYYQDQDSGINLVQTFIIHLSNDYKQGKLTDLGFMTLKQESDKLITQL
jgi:hypothetical protein